MVSESSYSPRQRIGVAAGPSKEHPEGPALKSCFVVAPIGAENSETRRRSDQILNHIIKPVVDKYNYHTTRSDLIDSSGSVQTQIFESLTQADLVIADLTGHNPNVFYELAVRHAVAKPYVQLIQSGESVPFDVTDLRTIFVDHRDLDSVARAKKSLENALDKFEAMEPGRPVETPIGRALEFRAVTANAKAEESEVLAVLAESIEQMRADIARVTRLNTHPRRNNEVQSGDFRSLREFIEYLARNGRLLPDDRDALITGDTSLPFDRWVDDLVMRYSRSFDRENSIARWRTAKLDEADFD